MKEIPDVKYELSEDGDLLTIEQGTVEPTYVVLHKIHLQHFVNVMKVQANDDQASPRLVEYLERINEQAENLYELLKGVPSFPPQQQEGEDVLLAKQLMDTANLALCFWGNN